jgi:hypothetical protein
MIETDPGDVSLLHQVQQQRMGGGKHPWVLHAQAREIVDVEEPAVVDLIERRPPVRQTIRLQFEQTVQPIEALGRARLPVDLGHRAVDVVSHLARAVRERGQALPRHFLGALPFEDRRLVGFGIGRHGGQRGEDVPQLADVGVIGSKAGVERLHPLAQHQRRAARVDGQHPLEIFEHQRPVVEHHLELAPFEDLPVLVAENGQQHLVPELLLDRFPVDVEEPRVRGAGTVFEHIPPPRVGLRIDGHVIGNEIDEQPQAVGAERPRQGVEIAHGANLGIQLAVIGDVVAVGAAFAGGEDRRAVAVADAQITQIGRERLEVAKRERVAELNAIRGNRDPQGPSTAHVAAGRVPEVAGIDQRPEHVVAGARIEQPEPLHLRTRQAEAWHLFVL